MTPNDPSGELHATEVNLSGLLAVLGENLYSTPVVALRELVQNGHDSCLRRALETGEAGEPSIRVRAEPDGRLTVEDTGAGLTRQEMMDFLATIGASYTRELRDSSGNTSLIGCFGLGFLSAFVIAERVTVYSTSYRKPGEGWVYQSRNGQSYTLRPAAPRPIGTLVELDLKPKFHRLAAEGFLRSMLGRTCALLSTPVHVGGSPEPINEVPPWRRDDKNDHPVARRKRRLAFAGRFEPSFEPIATIDVLPDEKTDIRGLLWIQDGATYGSSDNRNACAFVRGMLVDSDAKDLLPSWAGFIGGVFESERLTPTASREDLQRDHVFDAARTRIEAALVEGLLGLVQREPEAWRRILLRHNESLRGACLCDDRLFGALADHLKVPTTEGDLTAGALRARSADRRLYVSLDSADGFEEMLCRGLGVPMALGFRYAALPFLDRWCASHHAMLVRLGTGEGNLRVFERARLADDDRLWLAEMLGVGGDALVPARFEPPELPCVFVPNRDAELKERIESDEADRKISTAALGLARMFTAGIETEAARQLFVNLRSPLIERLLGADRAHPRTHDIGRLLRSVVVLQTRAAGMTDGNAFRDALKSVTEILAAWIDRKDE